MFKVKRCGESVLTTGFGILEMPPALLASFRRMVEEFPLIETANKADFSFASDTDGFLPFGSEYAKLEGHPDLCERFCYWSIHADRRQSHPFSKSRFVQAASAYEAEIHSLAQGVVDAICEEFGASPLESIRSSSYMQLCVYGRATPSSGRKFAQDPHEDGHLLSFIKPSRDGLVLVRGRALEPVRLLENEIAVLAGSLLTDLSDQAIPAAYHAVLTPSEAAERSSLIYFVNPHASQELFGFHRGMPLNLARTMNARHTAFGNQALKQDSTPTAAIEA